MNKKIPNILVFDDDELIRLCWDYAGRQRQNIDTLHFFSCWEEFDEKATPDLLDGAVAFVDLQFDKVRSNYNGIDIAKKLRAMGISKVYSITGNPRALADSRSLFTGIIEKTVPSDIRAFVA